MRELDIERETLLLPQIIIRTPGRTRKTNPHLKSYTRPAKNHKPSHTGPEGPELACHCHTDTHSLREWQRDKTKVARLKNIGFTVRVRPVPKGMGVGLSQEATVEL